MVVTRPRFLLRVCRSRSRFLGVKLIPFSFAPSWESWSTGRTMALPESSHHGLSVRPQTSSLLFWTAGADRRCELVGSSSFAVRFDRLVVKRVAWLSSRQGDGCLGRKNPYRLRVDFPCPTSMCVEADIQSINRILHRNNLQWLPVQEASTGTTKAP